MTHILIVLLTGIAVFIVLKIAGYLLKKITHRYALRKGAQKAFPLIEIVFWIAFVFWATGMLFTDNVLYSSVIIILVVIIAGLFSWFILRDVIAGAIFRAQNDLNKGDFVKIGDLSGQIKSVGITHIEITSDNGQNIKIPNTHLSRDLISGMTTPEGMDEYKFNLVFDNRFAKSEIEEKIRFEIANSPWCNFKNPPVIKLQKEDTTGTSWDVLIYTLNHSHFRTVERNLRDKFGI
ncbi:MAG: mechanosensitive ion channel [Clostridia bacterium]|nr:mechanosensitive ion channel [Clostridia bacterium]